MGDADEYGPVFSHMVDVPPQADGLKVKFSVDLDPLIENAEKGGVMSFWDDLVGFFHTAFHFFQKVEPIAETGLSIAAAITQDPKVVAASNITHAAAPILADVAQAVEDGQSTITVDPGKAQALVDAIKAHGAVVTH